MKQILTLAFTACLVLTLSAQKQEKLDKKVPRPSGCEPVKMTDSWLFVSDHEVTLAEWRTYVESGGKADLVENPYNQCLANLMNDSRAVYRDTAFAQGKKGKKEVTKVLCADMPVTGVSYQQAFAYCQWLTQKHLDDPNLADFKFRLATPEEMTFLVGTLLNISDQATKAYKTGLNERGCSLYNHKHNSWCESNLRYKWEFGYGVPIPILKYFPSNWGIYDLMGNVAEMTSVEGTAMGGSCANTPDECQPGVVNKYDGPAYWLGFRIVANIPDEYR